MRSRRAPLWPLCFRSSRARPCVVGTDRANPRYDAQLVAWRVSRRLPCDSALRLPRPSHLRGARIARSGAQLARDAGGGVRPPYGRKSARTAGRLKHWTINEKSAVSRRRFLHSSCVIESGCLRARADELAVDQHLGNLHSVEGCTLAQVVGHHPERKTVFHGRIFPDA